MKTHILRALSEKSFFNLWVGEVFTQIAVNLFNFFLILLVFKLTQSNTAVSVVVIFFTVPAILFGSLAGVFVDRWNKKKVLIITNIVRALLFLLLIFYLDNLIIIYLIALAVSIFTQFFIPAESPIIPLVVQRKNLLSANALFGMGIFGSMLVAYVLTGPLLIAVGQAKTLFILAGLILIGAGFISIVKLTHIPRQKKLLRKLNIVGEIKETLVLIFQNKQIFHALLLIAVSQILILILATIAPGYASQILGLNVEEFPLLFVAPAALGMIVGAVVLVNVFHSHPRRKVIIAGLLLSGVAMLLMPYGSKGASGDFIQIINNYLPQSFHITILHFMAILAFLLGVANSLVFVPANTVIQEKTTDEFRGKIYGFLNSIIGITSLLPIILVGGLSDLWGVGNVISGIGIFLILFAFTRIIIK